jgi:hypothetical protein
LLVIADTLRPTAHGFTLILSSQSAGRQQLGAALYAVSHWVLGPSLLWLLPFHFGLGVRGIWAALAIVSFSQGLGTAVRLCCHIFGELACLMWHLSLFAANRPCLLHLLTTINMAVVQVVVIKMDWQLEAQRACALVESYSQPQLPISGGADVDESCDTDEPLLLPERAAQQVVPLSTRA